MTTKENPLWEVFVRPRRGLSHTHVGSLHAPDAQMALRNARDLYTRREEGVSIWVIPASEITASSPQEKDAFFDPAADKIYRHPTFYQMPEGAEHMTTVEEVLALADDALIASQRLAEWSSQAHDLEEDIALSNIALDLLGQARPLLTYAGQLEGRGRDEDALAYLRDEREFLNCQLVELPRGDFAFTVVRMLFFSAYQLGRYEALSAGGDATLAAVAAKAVKEVAYHADHATQWTIRLGDGTDESHDRAQNALDELWPYTYELFEDAPQSREAWLAGIDPVLTAATLTRPAEEDVVFRATGGRQGIHTEHFGYMIAEFQHLHRSHPGATW